MKTIFFGVYPLVNVYQTMEHHHAINEKTHYKWPFSIAMLNYQRVPHFGATAEVVPHDLAGGADDGSGTEEEMDPGVPWNHGAKAPPVALRQGWFDPRPGPPGSRPPTQSSTDGSRSVAGSGGARPDMVGRWNLIGYTRVGMNKAGIHFNIFR